MLSSLFRAVYFLSLVLVILGIITIIFNTVLSGYYLEIISVLKPAMNSIVPYIVDYQTALLITETVLIMFSIRFLVFIYKIIS